MEMRYVTGNSQLQSLVSSNIATYEGIANLEDYSAPTGVRQPDGLTESGWFILAATATDP
jgi:hypothetical protein